MVLIYEEIFIIPKNKQAPLIFPMSAVSVVLRLLLALLFPPISVLVERGCGADFLINLGLSLLGWLPGAIHAVYIVDKVEKEKRLYLPIAVDPQPPEYEAMLPNKS